MTRKMILMAVVLGGCSDVDRATTAVLAGQNPLEADPGGYTVVIDLPPGLGLEENGAALGLEARFRDQTVSERFYLEQTGLADGGIALAVMPGDLPKMRALQTQILAWEAEAPAESNGSLTASLDPCRTGLPVPDDSKVRISIRTVPEGPLMPLLRPYSARKLIDRVEAEAGVPLPLCGATRQR